MYPFRFIAKCQSLSIEEQFKRGIRLFDIRISYDNNSPEFRHGLIAYKEDVYKILDWLNKQGEPIKIRIILEESKSNLTTETLFIKDCNRFPELYSNLTFYEGRRKCDWKQLVNYSTLKVEQPVSSMQENKLWSIWPWLYAKTHNNLEKYKNSTYVLVDFYK